MATAATISTVQTEARRSAPAFRTFAALLAAMGLPLGVFGLANLGAELLGAHPLFFAPFGLPGWAGAVAHFVQLGLLGAAFWALQRTAAKSPARLWLVALTMAYIALPFVTPPLDSMQLSLVATALFLLSLATAIRVGRASPVAGWLMAPMLAVIGFSATMGLAISAAYAPPFALLQHHSAPPAS